MNRVVCWFSCGAASAVATKLAIADNTHTHTPLVIANTVVRNEHPDNDRFSKDCERWFGQSIETIINEKFDGDIYKVFEQTGFMVGPFGAACTTRLKRNMRKDYEREGDVQVFGFTAEEQDRADDFRERNPHLTLSTPLIDHKVTKADCLAILKSEGIEIPAMYKLGYKNNNCIGCVKGGAGYWNKIRIDFPDEFERMSQMEQKMGVKINKISIGGVRTRVYLKDLPPNVGRYAEEEDIECGVVCKTAKLEWDDEL